MQTQLTVTVAGLFSREIISVRLDAGLLSETRYDVLLSEMLYILIRGDSLMPSGIT